MPRAFEQLAHAADLLVKRVGVRYLWREGTSPQRMEPEHPPVPHGRSHLGTDFFRSEQVRTREAEGQVHGLFRAEGATDARIEHRPIAVQGREIQPQRNIFGSERNLYAERLEDPSTGRVLDRIVAEEGEDARVGFGSDSRPHDHDLANLSRGEKSVKIWGRGGFDRTEITGHRIGRVAQPVQHDQDRTYR